MSDAQEPSCSNSSPKTRARFRNNARKISGKLPTPPPDPTLPTSPQDSDEVFLSSNALDYINSLQRTMFTSVIATEDAFDHLDKLYKLMEQMLDLRQQNARLLNRIRDLEHLKNLETMHCQLNVSGNAQDFDDDAVFAESLLDAMLTDTKKDIKNKQWARSLLTQSVRKRQMSSSNDTDPSTPSRKLSSSSSREKSSKISKWTKVKAAFRWEKASSSVTGAKSQDSGIGGMTPINCEVARYLRVPSSDDAGNSPADSGAADGSTPGSLSSASSNDDVHRQEIRHDSQFSDDDRKSIARKEIHGGTKGHIKKTRPHYEEPISANRSEDERIDTSDREYHNNSQRSSTKSSKGRQRRSGQTQIPDDVVERYQKAVADEERASKNSNRKRVSKWVRVKKAFLNPTIDDQRTKPLPCLNEGVAYNTTDDKNKVQEEIRDNYKQLQNKLSLEFKGKLLEWEKLKATGSGTSSRIDSVSEEPRNPAFAKKIEEWDKLRTQPLKTQCSQIVREEDLAPEFKKKLEEWQRIKKHPAKDDLVPTAKIKKRLGEWPRWKSVSGHRDDHDHNEPQPLSGDFLKKLEEWKKIKETNKHVESEKTPSPSTARKQSLTTPVLKPSPDQHLEWFESELNKIEMERSRLVSERQKFLQREERLGKLRRTVLGNENKKDVLIHTPSGFYRFEGISKKFTQKLCQWEASQGIGPEASTFALLSSSFTPHITVNLCEKDQGQKPRMHRSKSAESVSVSHLTEVVQVASHHPSSLSLNDIDELERQCLALSTDSSYQNISQSFENVVNDEPEAIIVEFEDIVEETAAPLEEYLEEKHFPIYQRECVLNTCEKQELVIPDVQEATNIDNSANAQNCCCLLDEVLELATKLKDGETQSTTNVQEIKSKNQTNTQILLSTICTKLVYLQEIHSKNISNMSQIKGQPTTTHFADLLESSQDLFTQLFQMLEQNSSKSEKTDICGKLTELKRVFTYFYAKSDRTAPKRRRKVTREEVKENKETYIDPALIEKFVISTNTNYLNKDVESNAKREPASVIVNTTRRLFTPIEEVEPSAIEEHQNATLLLDSPTMQRKLPKEISPGIRVMLAKYNQMITGQDLPKSTLSGSSSPIAWRSPVSERRVNLRRQRYIDELSKSEDRHDVIKSASAAVLNSSKPTSTTIERSKSILRSTSTSVIQNRPPSLTIEISENEMKQASEERYYKLQRAKEDFMRSAEIVELAPEPSSAPPICSKDLKFSSRCRYSQASMESESSCDSGACALVKSASAGMINIDEATYREIDPAMHQYGYLSLPRVATKQKGGILEELSNIAAKFRNVKMKRNKKMNAVSALCRQSLVVDLNPGSHENLSVMEERLRHDSLTVPTPSSSEDTSPCSSRSGSWIRRARIFKAL